MRQPATDARKAHASLPVIDDARQIQRATATQCQGAQRRGVDLGADRQHTAPIGRPRCSQGIAAMWRRWRARPRRARPRAAVRGARATDGAGRRARVGLLAGSRRARRWGIQGRHPQMPVRTVALDRSNKWGHLRQVRLSAARQTCTVLSARLLAPWVFQLGSRGNPARLSNTAGDACSHSTPKSLRAVAGAQSASCSAQSSSCWPFSSAASTRSRNARSRWPVSCSEP